MTDNKPSVDARTHAQTRLALLYEQIRHTIASIVATSINYLINVTHTHNLTNDVESITYPQRTICVDPTSQYKQYAHSLVHATLRMKVDATQHYDGYVEVTQQHGCGDNSSRMAQLHVQLVHKGTLTPMCYEMQWKQSQRRPEHQQVRTRVIRNT